MIPVLDIGPFHISSYFLVISISLTILLVYLSKRVETFNKNRKIAFDLAILLMAAGFTGGRLLHVFYEEWPYYQQHPEQVLFFWNGGFVFLGGLLMCLLAGFVFAKIKKLNFGEWADFFTPLFSLSHALGRIGCLLSGCCFGSYCTLPWSLEGRHPTALYMIFGESFIFLLMLMFEQQGVYKKPGMLFAKWLLLHSLLRFNVEYFRDDFRGVFINLPLLGSLSVSQVISLAIIVGTLIFFYVKRERVEIKT